jgi:MFS transporter, ACS family, hexuronate transporter
MNPTIGKYRWRMVALLFFATTVNYIDRQVLSFVMTDPFFKKQMLGLAPDVILTEQNLKDFKISLGLIDSSFKAAYAMGFLLIGWLIDKIGTKKGFALGIIIWSLSGMANFFVSTLGGLRITRFMLGIGESANFPSAIKTVSEWFPKKEHSFASGVFNAGSNVGIIITSIAIPYIILNYGWRSAFIFTGCFGVILLITWWFTYEKPEESTKLTKEEFDYIHSDKNETAPNAKKISWFKLLSYKQTWALAVGKFMADPIWWFYMTWLPDFFNTNKALDQKLDLKTFGIPFLVIYLISDFGSMFFGWLSTKFINIGWTPNRARKTTMFICALCITPIYFASVTHNLYVAIGLIALATAAHQGWSANMYTFPGGLFPKNVVASVTGIGGMFGAIGGVLLAAAAGYIIANFGYQPMFILASCSYMIALVIINFILPNMEPVEL